MLRVLLLLAAVLSASVEHIDAVQKTGNLRSQRESKFQHLRQQFEAFKKELDELMVEPAVEEEPVVEEAKPQQLEESSTDFQKRCDECDDSIPEKRCPSGCAAKKKKSKTLKTAATTTDCVRRCPTCTECVNDQPPAEIPQSKMMKRFLKALPEQDKKLIEGSTAKRQFIERLIQRSYNGPNANDIAAEKKRTEARVNAIADIGVRSMPSEDSSVMVAFKRSLGSRDQQLLQKYKSKTRFIEGVLEKKSVHDKRDVDVAKTSNEKKRQFEDPVVAKYLQNLDESQKALIKQNPSMLEHLKTAILEGNRKGQEEKRELSPDQVQEVLNKLGSKEEAELVKQHPSVLEHLAKAEKKPVGNPDQEMEQVVSRLANDITIAKKRGYDLEKLLAALKKRSNENRRT